MDFDRIREQERDRARNGDFEKTPSSAVCYCWYIWEKGFKGEPVIRWI